MRLALVPNLALVSVLSACVESPAPAPVPAPARAPAVAPSAPADLAGDRQEGGPVTNVVNHFAYEDAGKIWHVSINRTSAIAPGVITVFGPGELSSAQAYAAQGCAEEGGRFDAAVQASPVPLRSKTDKGYRFRGGCL